VHVGDRLHNLINTGNCLLNRQRPFAADHLLQVLARHIFHHQILMATRLNKVVEDLRQMGVAQMSKQHRLATELALRLFMVVEILLDRHRAARQIQILGEIDRAHTAPPQ